jgi:nickel-dependent lactate racemase
MHYYYTYYPKVREIEIPDANLIGVYGPLETPHGDREKILREAFEHPVNSQRISEIATAEDRVLIVLDDALEPTPTVFPFYHVIQELHAAGVSDGNITVLLANAGHRASSNEEVDRKMGAEMRRHFKVYQSALNTREESYHTFGTAHTDLGPVTVTADRRLLDASLIIGIGGTYPNRFKGFTGGGSLVFPGLGNEQMISEVYSLGVQQPAEQVLGVTETPARRLIRELIPFVPSFKFCIDIVIDKSLAITSCVTGSPGSVYRVSADVAARVTNFSVPEPADIVVIDSHPFDGNLLQAAHALYAAKGILKQGGEIIIVSPLLDAVHPLWHTLANHLSEPKETLLRSGQSGELSNHPYAAMQLAALREVKDRASRITFVTHGPGMNDPKLFGFEQTDHAQDALNAALKLNGHARVTLITHGGLTVPRVQ